MKYTKSDLIQRQSLPLADKVALTKMRIKAWCEHYDGEVYVCFSGGKDSTVLKHIVDSVYPDIPSVFVNTGLEYPEIRQFALSQKNVVRVDPKMKFYDVIQKYGYPVVGKKQARFIRDLQNASDKNKATVNLRLTGFNRKGEYCSSQILAKKWVHLKDAPFKVSEQCCDYMKKEPLKRYQRETGRFPIIGTMTHESDLREKEWLKNGCNAFEKVNPTSQPISFWTEQDILQYIVENGLQIASVYGEVVKENGAFRLTGEQRTGCMFCMFGVHLEDEPNRFQRMKMTHPKQYEYCINELGLGEVLDYLGVKYE